MAEQLDQTVIPAPILPSYRVVGLSLDWDSQTVIIRLKGSDGVVITQTYASTDGALALMTALNKANLSVKSLQRRILEKLVADGRLAGTISGVVD